MCEVPLESVSESGGLGCVGLCCSDLDSGLGFTSYGFGFSAEVVILSGSNNLYGICIT